MLPPIVEEQGLRATLTFIITGTRADRIDMPPKSLWLGMDACIAVNFRCGRLENFCPQTLGKSQHVDRAVDTRLRRLHWIVLVVNRRSRAVEVVDLVDPRCRAET